MQFPVKTRIFSAINVLTGQRELMDGIPWEVLIYYDPPWTRPKPRVRLATVGSACRGLQPLPTGGAAPVSGKTNESYVSVSCKNNANAAFVTEACKTDLLVSMETNGMLESCSTQGVEKLAL